MSKNLNTTFILNGGAGRVIASIPALEKYHRLNPNDNFKVLVYGWDSIFWSHPVLQDKVFEINQKGIFEEHIRQNKVVVPEPYNVHGFYNQKLNIIEAFDEEINKTENHSDLKNINLYMSQMEKIEAKNICDNFLHSTNKKKLIIFQPFGSGAKVTTSGVLDPSNRSMYSEDYFTLVQNISSDALILFISNQEHRHSQDNITAQIDSQLPYFRYLISLMPNADYFVGCDSVGQYIAKAFNIPGLVMYGATSEKNYGFPDHFRIIRNSEREPKYSPWRISQREIDFADRINDGIMKFNDKDLKHIADIINKDLKL